MASSILDEEVIPDSQGEEELEYNEAPTPAESDDSGSEFELSDEDDEDDGSWHESDVDDIQATAKLHSFAEALEEDGIDADDIVMDIVVKESLEMARSTQIEGSSGAGSSKKNSARTVAAALRAAAAEGRLTRSQQPSEVIDVDAYNSDVLDDSSLSEVSISDGEPLAKAKGKSKAKGKAKAKAPAKSKSAGSAAKIMTIGELRQQKREQRKEKRRQADERKKEERAMRKKLGRKLTQVCHARHCKRPVHSFLQLYSMRRIQSLC